VLTGPSKVSIELGEQDTDYWLEVANNGKGFDVTKQPSGFGISGMQQRVESMHGRLDIETRPGDGTIIKGSIPKQGEMM
jgi:signal transduction histidine kinase